MLDERKRWHEGIILILLAQNTQPGRGVSMPDGKGVHISTLDKWCGWAPPKR